MAQYGGIILILLALVLAVTQWTRVLNDFADKAEAIKRKRAKRLKRNANREHKLVQEGKVDGVYGDFSPPADVRGIGIWLTDKT